MTGAPITCPSPDQCHYAGTCDSTTGTCSYQAKPSNTPCDDGDLCTRSDSCQNGKCTGGAPVSCNAADQCHSAGTCDPATGRCSSPIKPNGTACDDRNACTQVDSCQEGTCVGASPLSCKSFDQCHGDGTCDPSTGQCSNPIKPNGTTCNDSNACTRSDSCQDGTCAGTDPVTCSALDECHNPGTCDPQTGHCSNPNKAESSPCDDGDLCTRGDHCEEGDCVPGVPITCSAGQCHGEGECDPLTGRCTLPPVNEGGQCNDQDECTTNDACQDGTCRGEGQPCTPDASPLDAPSDAGIDASVGDSGIDGSKTTEEPLDPELVNYYGCNVMGAARRTGPVPLFLAVLMGSFLAIYRTKR
ncbi:MAG: hypothetical protein HY698_00735 [Deltaproteobacteria bacterium]|nr:hypothetical protein [Deltaproteobacteria bacterium]